MGSRQIITKYMFKIIYTIGSEAKFKEINNDNLESALIQLRNEELEDSKNGEIDNIEIMSIERDGFYII